MLYATSAHVDLKAIEANLRAVRGQVGDRLVLLAVKADAYGHGAVAVSLMCQRTGAADWLGVATVPEALELRAAGVTLPILKLSHALTPAEASAAVDAGVALTVIDEPGARLVSRAASGRGAEVHLKVDTGMRRIGVEPGGAVPLARLLRRLPGIDLTGIMTHLPVSDTPSGADFTASQLARFSAVAADVQSEVGPLPHVHAANSGGVCGHPASWGTLVRPGIMAYGSYPDRDTAPTVPIVPALSLVSRVSYVKQVPAGETVGYGRTWTAPTDTWVATVPIGYGDGYSRLLSNRGTILVRGRPFRIAGRVCMDQTMLDLGPRTDVVAGDEVVAIGRQGEAQITAWDVADLMGTIPYEVTCLLTRRVTRTYG